MAKKKTHHLSIYLLKQGFSDALDVINSSNCWPVISIPITPTVTGSLFIQKSQDRAPKWALLFEGYLSLKSLEATSFSGALFASLGARSYILAFGQSGRFLIKSDVCEERFGLICALNSIDPGSFRAIDVQSLDAIQSQTRIQAGEATTPDQFGLDVEQDMLKAIVGVPKNPVLGSRMAGSDPLSVSVKLDLDDLPQLLAAYRTKFETDLSSADYEWVNNISIVKSSALISELESRLDKKLSKRELDDIWLSIPEIIEWNTVVGFMYTHGRREIHSDISMDGFLKTVKPGITLNLNLLRERMVTCADSDHQAVLNRWPVFKCLYAEVAHGNRKYILNGGKWYEISTDFEVRTNQDFAKIRRSKLTFPVYNGGGEGEYNKAIADAHPTQYALLDDVHKIFHGGGHGQVEVCDLLSVNRELIHVKIYSKSSVLSHLFAQGFVSGQLIQIDANFRGKVRAKLKGPFQKLINVTTKPAQDDFTIVYAIISSVKGALHLPFFSRVNLNNTAKVLKGFGYKVELLKIEMDEMFAKKLTGPPSGARKRARKRRKP
jgi:uncharacterized protein (TIGR04141 family)